MRAARLPLRRSVPVAAAVSLLLAAGCTAGGGVPGPADGSGSSSDGRGPAAVAPGATTATPLEPLPAQIPPNLARYYAQQLGWQSCDGEFECTTFKVPLDYADPAAGDVTLTAARLRSTGGTGRLGSLLVNPGGPGGSAVEYMEGSARSFDPGLRARYDLVGLDPRGVGRSSPVTCLSGDRMDAFTAVDITPDDQAEIDALVVADKEFAEGCRQRSGAVLGHVSTVEAARDMDVLRALLGDERLSYLGKSYGTFLGATYAGLYPARVGRMVLDGAMDPSLDAVGGTRAGGRLRDRLVGLRQGLRQARGLPARPYRGGGRPTAHGPVQADRRPAAAHRFGPAAHRVAGHHRHHPGHVRGVPLVPAAQRRQ